MNEDKFYGYVNKNGPVKEMLGECWLWTGSKRTGYGLVAYYKDGKRTTTSAHIWAWKLAGRELKPGQLLKHKCNNSLCIRPEHMVIKAGGIIKTIPKSSIKRINKKLTEEEHKEILAALSKPYHGQGKYLADKYGVHPSMITLIKQNKIAKAWLVSIN